jgi:hypothetical protein
VQTDRGQPAPDRSVERLFRIETTDAARGQGGRQLLEPCKARHLLDKICLAREIRPEPWNLDR